MGNAVSPCVASALGRCLALAAAGAVPADLDHAVVPVPDPQLIKVVTPSSPPPPAAATNRFVLFHDVL